MVNILVFVNNDSCLLTVGSSLGWYSLSSVVVRIRVVCPEESVLVEALCSIARRPSPLVRKGVVIWTQRLVPSKWW